MPRAPKSKSRATNRTGTVPVTHDSHGTNEPFPKPQIRTTALSPHRSSRNSVPIRRIVLHYTTSATAKSAVNWFLDPKSRVSAHYVINKNGDIYQCVPDGEKAWHAKGDNVDSIGIEHAARKGECLTAKQEAASVALIRWLMSEYKIPKTEVLGHRFAPSNIGSTDCPDCLFGTPTKEAFDVWIGRHFS